MAFFGRPKRATAAPAAAPGIPGAPDANEVGLRDVSAHRDFLISQAPALRPFGIGLMEVGGLTLCEELRSDIDLPFYTSAQVAGFAVRTANLVGASLDHPIVLPVVDSVSNDGYAAEPLPPGASAKVEIGAPVPEGADAVVAFHEIEQVFSADGPEGIRVTAEVVFGQNLRQVGSRVSDQDLLLTPGTVLNPRHVAMLAEVGLDKVLARPKPRVVVATVADNLVEPGLPLARLNQTYDCTTALVSGLVRDDGGKVFPIGILPSDPAVLRSRLSEQLVRADLVLLVGEADLTETLAQLGPYDTADVAMSPGGPRLFGKVGSEEVPLLVLPGRPVSAFVSYVVFGRPLVRSLGGQEPLSIKVVEAPCLEDVNADPDSTQFLLGERSERGVQPLHLPADAGAVELSRANALIVVPPGRSVLAHQDVTCWELDS
ncbi:MAG: molybdopterin molybdotransferase MoeA [Propionibacteriaceae bacterium]|jgi:molybdopterin molybdotransferase|nr:molybdopterin molybdotransferase MoeA [Propionibacteriaceae bacterium]